MSSYNVQCYTSQTWCSRRLCRELARVKHFHDPILLSTSLFGTDLFTSCASAEVQDLTLWTRHKLLQSDPRLKRESSHTYSTGEFCWPALQRTCFSTGIRQDASVNQLSRDDSDPRRTYNQSSDILGATYPSGVVYGLGVSLGMLCPLTGWEGPGCDMAGQLVESLDCWLQS